MNSAVSQKSVEVITDLTISERLLTCGACEQLVPANDEGTLASHERKAAAGDDVELQCVGSYQQGYRHRMLPEAAPLLTRIEILDSPVEPGVDRNLEAVAQSVRFLNRWLANDQMPTDRTSLVRVAGHANNIQHAALSLIDAQAMFSPHARRRLLLNQKR